MFDFIRRYFTLEIYTDGGSKDGVGTWAYVITKRGKCISENAGRARCSNSNTMEFQAAIEALSSIPKNSTVTVLTDSKVLIDTVTTGQGHASFLKQIDTLLSLSQIHTIQWQWVKAHNGNKFNERCDELCTQSRNQVPGPKIVSHLK